MAQKKSNKLVDGVNLNVEPSFCYLGDILSSVGGCEQAIKACCYGGETWAPNVSDLQRLLRPGYPRSSWTKKTNENLV